MIKTALMLGLAAISAQPTVSFARTKRPGGRYYFISADHSSACFVDGAHRPTVGLDQTAAPAADALASTVNLAEPRPCEGPDLAVARHVIASGAVPVQTASYPVVIAGAAAAYAVSCGFINVGSLAEGIGLSTSARSGPGPFTKLAATVCLPVSAALAATLAGVLFVTFKAIDLIVPEKGNTRAGHAAGTPQGEGL